MKFRAGLLSRIFIPILVVHPANPWPICCGSGVAASSADSFEILTARIGDAPVSKLPASSPRSRLLASWPRICRMHHLVLIFLAGITAPAAWAESGAEIHDLYRGSRTKAMGGSYTAVADDDQTIFLNPAGLAGMQKQAINYGVLDLEVSKDVISNRETLSAFSTNTSGDKLNAVMGKNVSGRAQFAPTMTMSNIGVGLIVDDQLAVHAKNKALPQITLGYQQTNGFQFAYGISAGRTRGGRTQGELRLGVGGKLLWRRGGYYTLPLSTLLNISFNTLKSIAGNFGRGIGYDAGALYVHTLNSRLSISLGVAMTEIGDITFSSGADPQRGCLSTGIAGRYKLPKANLLLSYDYRNILQDTDVRKKNHFGLEVALPIISLYGGLNQTYVTYGASVNAWMFKVMAVSYAEELSSSVGLDPERRYLVRLVFGFGL